MSPTFLPLSVGCEISVPLCRYIPYLPVRAALIVPSLRSYFTFRRHLPLPCTDFSLVSARHLIQTQIYPLLRNFLLIWADPLSSLIYSGPQIILLFRAIRKHSSGQSDTRQNFEIRFYRCSGRPKYFACVCPPKEIDLIWVFHYKRKAGIAVLETTYPLVPAANTKRRTTIFKSRKISLVGLIPEHLRPVLSLILKPPKTDPLAITPQHRRHSLLKCSPPYSR